MRKIFTIVALALCFLTFKGFAQGFEVCTYGVNAVNYFDVSRGIPNSDISFYSDMSGGRLLQNVTLDASGHALYINTEAFKPAFLLSVLNRAAQQGSGIVVFTPEKEFTIKDMQLEDLPGLVRLSWSATVSPKESIRFEVWKNNLGNSKKIYEIEGFCTEFQRYSFIDNEASKSSYEIRVVNTNKGLRYTGDFQSKTNSGNSQIQVYPTLIQDVCHVLLTQDAAKISYELRNVLGQKVKQGSLDVGDNILSFVEVPNGDYFLIAHIGVQQQTQKICKRS
ncbi:MAG: hypothetical protein ABI378_11680 [Chitinophagaceae bacterium]